MSLSNLSSQLASLNSSSSAVAAVAAAASSRKHEDAIGRGLYHSAKHGHTLVTPMSSSIKFKPSVIHPDAKTAARADISLVALRENALQALQFINEQVQSPFYEMSNHGPGPKETTKTKKKRNTFAWDKLKYTWKFLLGIHSLDYERKLHTQDENKELNKHLQNAFLLLSSVLGEEGTNTSSTTTITSKQQPFNITSAVLHILEYLIQLYLPHVYNAESLIYAFLPHHESFIFQRLIQLIDLATVPQWSFLRPFTFVDSSSSNNSTTVRSRSMISRSCIAKWVASKTDNGSGNGLLFRDIGQFTQQIAQLHAWEAKYYHHYHYNSDPKGNNTTAVTDDDITVTSLNHQKHHVRLGISFIISFTTALFVEAMSIQAQALGTLSEMTVRILLPWMLDALGPSQDPFILLKSTHTNQDMKKSLGSTCLDWRNFGYILAFALNENCELDIQVLELLSTTAVYGCLENQLELQMIQTTTNPQAVHDIVPVAALVLFLLCMSKSMSKKIHLELSVTQPCYCLPKISKTTMSTIVQSNRNRSSDGGFMGCYIPRSTFNALTRVKILPSTLSFLLDQKGIDIKDFISSIIAQCISSLKKPSQTATSQQEKDTNVDLVLSMVRTTHDG